MEQLLKKVFAVHKDTLRNATANLMKYKTAHEKEVAKCHQLQKNLDELLSENRKLNMTVKAQLNRDGNCCEVIKHSLDSVVSSYKQMLADRDSRINLLEKELNRLRRKAVTRSSKQLKKDDRLTLPDCNTDLSSSGTSYVDFSECTQTNPAANISADEGLMFETSPDDTRKFKLNRKSKRSRYSEDESTYCNKSKRSRLLARTNGVDIDKPAVNCEVEIKETGRADLIDNRYIMKECIENSKVGELNENIIVAETCAQALNESGKLMQESALVVQETPAIDMNDTLTVNIDHYRGSKKEGKINEISDNFLNLAPSYLPSEKKMEKCDKNVSKYETIPQSFRDILFSPSRENISEEKMIRADELDLVECESLVKDSDDESYIDTFETSQTFSKSRLVTKHVANIELDTRNSCTNIVKGTALIEIPGKEYDDQVSVKDVNQDTATKKSILKKHGSKMKYQCGFRRSPRKHYQVSKINSCVRKTPTAKNELHCKNIGIEPKLENMQTCIKQNTMHTVLSKAEQVNLAHTSDQKGGKMSLKVPVNVLDETLKSPSVFSEERKTKVMPVSEISANESAVIENNNSRTNGLKIQNNDFEAIRRNAVEEVFIEDSELERFTLEVSKTKHVNCSGTTEHANRDSSLLNDLFKEPKPAYVLNIGKNRMKSVRQTTLTQEFFKPECMLAKMTLENEDRKHSDVEADAGENIKFKKSSSSCQVSENEIRKENDNLDVDVTLAGKVGNNVLSDISNQTGKFNGSLDPSAKLSKWYRDPETNTDFLEADLQVDANLLPKTSTLVVEDTEDIPCSSSSVTFLPKRHNKRDAENTDPEKGDVNFEDSFDRLPRSEVREVAHVAVVRKQDERQKLQGHSCKECLEYYASAGRSDEEIKQHIQQCSRHRAQYDPPETPPHFWSIGFMETQDNHGKGCERECDVHREEDIPSYRRRKRLNKYFKSKNEKTFIEDEFQYTQ